MLFLIEKWEADLYIEIEFNGHWFIMYRLNN